MSGYISANSPGSATVAELRSRASRLGEMVSSKRVANNTIEATYTNGNRVIILHETLILEFRKNGATVVNTGGYNTHTTRDRLNRFLPSPHSVRTSNGNIYINGTPFQNTVKIKSDGTIVPDVKPTKLLSDRKLIDRFMSHVRKNGLPSIEKSGGDPWCFNPDIGKSVMRDWLESLYFTRAMYRLAMQFAGLTDHGAAYYAQMADQNGGKLDTTDLRRIRRYIRSQLGLAR